MSGLFLVLLLWSLCALAWWLISLVLVSRPRPTMSCSNPCPSEPQSLSIFKPVPAIKNAREREALEASVASWVKQMDQRCELLLGCDETEQAYWQAFCERVKPHGGNIRLISHSAPLADAANPKISWMQKLIPHAQGELWYWCDADMLAPEQSITRLFEDIKNSGAKMVTSPYTIRHAEGPASILDTLFVNVEFYPGVLLLERGDNIAFGFGSGMLFRASDFHQHVDLDFLGRALADDFHLGRMLQPVKLASTCLSTQVAAKDWRGAISHYRRWQKTIRWNRPGGFASQLMILPVFGWLLAVCVFPHHAPLWLGLIAMIIIDWAGALLICKKLACKLSAGAALAVPCWSILRVLVFVSCWLPIAVKWRGQTWTSAFASETQ